MSAHDPFDGIYDDAPQAEAEQASVEGSAEQERLSRSHLARMRRADLQALARDRGLDDSGDRDDLIARIYDAQGT